MTYVSYTFSVYTPTTTGNTSIFDCQLPPKVEEEPLKLGYFSAALGYFLQQLAAVDN
jgi:hypothetical protein